MAQPGHQVLPIGGHIVATAREPCPTGTLYAEQCHAILSNTGCKATVRDRGRGAGRELVVTGPTLTLDQGWQLAKDFINGNAPMPSRTAPVSGDSSTLGARPKVSSPKPQPAPTFLKARAKFPAKAMPTSMAMAKQAPQGGASSSSASSSSTQPVASSSAQPGASSSAQPGASSSAQPGASSGHGVLSPGVVLEDGYGDNDYDGFLDSFHDVWEMVQRDVPFHESWQHEVPFWPWHYWEALTLQYPDATQSMMAGRLPPEIFEDRHVSTGGDPVYVGGPCMAETVSVAHPHSRPSLRSILAAPILGEFAVLYSHRLL